MWVLAFLKSSDEFRTEGLRQCGAKLPPCVSEFVIQSLLDRRLDLPWVRLSCVRSVRQLFVYGLTPIIRNLQGHAEARSKMLCHDIVALLTLNVLEKVRKLPAIKIKGMAYMSVDRRFKPLAVDIEPCQRHFSRRHEIGILMNDMPDTIEVLLFFCRHGAECNKNVALPEKQGGVADAHPERELCVAVVYTARNS